MKGKKNMLKILSKERKVANRVKLELNKRGFLVDLKPAKKSKSVYLRIDNGACPGIRISNHKNLSNKRTNFTFNVIDKYNGFRTEFKNGQLKRYYNFNSIARLICEVEKERSDRIIKYGYSNYIKNRNKDQLNYFYRKVA